MPFCSAASPCLGRRFEDVWADIEPLVAQVFRGKPVHMDDITLFADRDGTPAETHFAFSYTPVYGEDGTAWGPFCPKRDTTAQIMIEREVATASAAAGGSQRRQIDLHRQHEARAPHAALSHHQLQRNAA